MTLDPKAVGMLSRGWYGERLEAEECIYLLTFREKSPVANLCISLADRLMHAQSANTGRVAADITVSTGPCPGNCGFCRWNEARCPEAFDYMPDDELAKLCEYAGAYSDVTEIRLGAIESTPVEDLAHFVEVASESSRKGTLISIDFGDLDRKSCDILRKAGASDAYHSCRLGEGKDTDIKPQKRRETIDGLIAAGFRTTVGTEPIGPEHSPKEIVDNFFEYLETDAKHAEIRGRETVPGSRMDSTISPARLAQIKAVLTLGSSWKSQSAYGFPIVQPYILGKNVTRAQYSMKDWRAQTEAARRRLFNAGFEKILLSDGSTADLSLSYLKQTGSI